MENELKSFYKEKFLKRILLLINIFSNIIFSTSFMYCLFNLNRLTIILSLSASVIYFFINKLSPEHF